MSNSSQMAFLQPRPYALPALSCKAPSSRTSPRVQSAFADTTNTPRSDHPQRHSTKYTHLPISNSCSRPCSHKAPPTVSLTNANANATSTTARLLHDDLDGVKLSVYAGKQSRTRKTSIIPFPYISSHLPSRVVEEECDNLTTIPTPYPNHSRTRKTSTVPFPSCVPPTLTDDEILILMKASASYTVPHPSDDGMVLDGCDAEQESEPMPGSPQIRLRRRRSQASAIHAKTRRERPNVKEDGLAPPARKRLRKSKKLISDLQSIATVHRSIVWRLRSLGRVSECDRGLDKEDENGDTVICDPNELVSETVEEAQDKLLAKRLWQLLVEQGCKPVVFDDVPVALSSSCSSGSISSTDAASPPPSGNVSRSRRDVSLPLSTHKRSLYRPSISPPHPLCIPVTGSVPSTDLPSPTSPIPGPARILTMPQLTASLIMQHKYKQSTRLRPKWKARSAAPECSLHDNSSARKECPQCYPQRRKQSPLSTIVYSASDGSI